MTDDNFPRFAWLHTNERRRPVLVNLANINTAMRVGEADDALGPRTLVYFAVDEDLTVTETPEEIARMLGAAEIDNGR